MNSPLSLHEVYDRWAEVYPPEPHNPLMQAEQAALLELMPSVERCHVLDLACGSGRYGAIARARGAAFVIGIDYSRAMLARAGIGARVRGDMARLPLRDQTFDLVICGLALGHATDLQACIAGISRVMRPGGVLLYSDFHDDAWRSGLTRSFKDARGNGVALPRDGFPPAQHRAGLIGAGFEIECMQELRVGIEFNTPFPNSEQFYLRHHGVPLLLIVRARKPS